MEGNHTKDGLLTCSQLEHLLVDMSDGSIDRAQLSAIMERFDSDRDGALNFDDFLQAFVTSPLMKVTHISDELKTTGQETRHRLAEATLRLQAEDWVQIRGCKARSVISH